MKIVSPVLNFLGHKLVGSASAMFGLPAGAFSDLYLMHYDRPAPQPDEVEKPEWMRRRVFEIYIRRQLSLRVGILASVLAMAVVVAGLLMLGGTAGLQHAWASHKAHEAGVAAKANAKSASVELAVKLDINEASFDCEGIKGGGQSQWGKSRQELLAEGCDITTGTLDIDKAKAWFTKKEEENIK